MRVDGTAPQWASEATLRLIDAINAWNQQEKLVFEEGYEEVLVAFIDDEQTWQSLGYSSTALAETGEWVMDESWEVESCVISYNVWRYGEEEWYMGSGDSPATKFDFTSVLVHEVGHAVGFGHVSEGHGYEACTVMTERIAKGEDEREPKIADSANFWCLYFDIWPDADTYGFNVADGSATWVVEREHETKEYVVEGCSTPNGPGTVLATEQPGIGSHDVHLDSSELPFFRLVEIETSGRRIVWEYAGANDSAALLSLGDRRRGDAQWAPPARAAPIPTESANGSKVVLIVALNWSDPVERGAQNLAISWIADWFTQKGYTVDTWDFGQEAQQFRRDAVKSAIAIEATANGTRYFHVLGNFADIPSSWIGSSMFSYDDIDDDHHTDVVVTRWPSMKPVELAGMLDKCILYQGSSRPIPYTTTFLVGDLDHGPGTNSGEITGAMADDVRDHLVEIAPNHVTTQVRESDYPDSDVRNLVAASHLNSYEPELIVLLSSMSWNHAPREFF